MSDTDNLQHIILANHTTLRDMKGVVATEVVWKFTLCLIEFVVCDSVSDLTDVHLILSFLAARTLIRSYGLTIGHQAAADACHCVRNEHCDMRSTTLHDQFNSHPITHLCVSSHTSFLNLVVCLLLVGTRTAFHHARLLP